MARLAPLLVNHDIILIFSAGKTHSKTTTEDIRELVKDKSVCYITVNKTADALKETFSREGINIENLLFVDAISRTIKDTPDEDKQVYYLSNPCALTDIAITISKVVKHNFQFIIIDSISNLTIYQEGNLVAKFLLSIINRVREKNAKLIMYAVDHGKDDSMVQLIESSVDTTVSAN